MTAQTVVLGCIAAWLCLGVAQARELRVADTHPAGYPTVQALDHMGRLLAERSHGQLTLKVLHSRLMGEEAETIQHVRIGALDMARVNMAPLADLVPEAMVPSLPFVFASTDHLHRVFDGPIGAEIAKAFESHGFVVLAFYDSGARSFYNSRHPVRQPSDLHGLRIRVQQSQVAEAMIGALGAVAAPLPYGQVGVGLSTGVIDGAENNWPSYQDAGHYKNARYYSRTEHTMAPEVLLISEKAWGELNAAEQAMLRQAAQDSVAVMRELWQRREQTAMQAVTQAGAEVNTVDKAAFVAAMRPVYLRFAATPHLADLLRRIRAAE
ncbi:MAG: TRAP transporter substrate-binding protein [Bacteroidota bacterium]